MRQFRCGAKQRKRMSKNMVNCRDLFSSLEVAGLLQTTNGATICVQPRWRWATPYKPGPARRLSHCCQGLPKTRRRRRVEGRPDRFRPVAGFAEGRPDRRRPVAGLTAEKVRRSRRTRTRAMLSPGPCTRPCGRELRFALVDDGCTGSECRSALPVGRK